MRRLNSTLKQFLQQNKLFFTFYNALKKRIIIIFVLMILSVSFLKTTAQVGPGIAPVNNPTSRFQIEGNLQANTPTSGVGDWLPDSTGGGGYVLTTAGVPVNGATTFHLTDLYNTSENNFAGGKKFNDNPNVWTWVNNNALAKCDINNGLFHFTTSNVGGIVHTWLIVAADRRSNSGNAYIDFELLQNTMTDNADGTFSSAGPNNGRTKGDILLTLALTNGGGAADFYVNKWDNPAGTYDYIDKTASTPAGAVYASTNAGNVPVSFSAFGLNQYSSNLFVEAAIDLTALLGAIDPCTSLGVKTLFIKTKTSQSPTATIVDFIKAQQVSLQIGVANAGPSQAQCGNTFSVTGTATPSPGDAVSSTLWSLVSGTAAIATPSSATTSVTVTGSPAILRYTVNTNFGCTVSDTLILSVSPPPAANAGSDATINCTTTSTTLGATGGVSYSWSPATGLSATNIANPVATPAATTTYTVTVTGANGCTKTDDVIVTVDKALPAANAGSDVTVNCTTPSTTLGATGGVSYSWSPATGLSATNIANPVATPAATTTYTVTVTGANGCTKTDDVIVTVDKALPAANAGSDVTVNCTTTSTTLGATGGVSYSWSPATGLSATNIANPVATPAATTTYTVTVTGANGCTKTDDVIVTVDNALPAANAGSDVTINCTTTSTTLGATGGVSYSWSPATGLSATNIANPVATPAATTAYTVTVTGVNGCTKTDDVVVTVDKTLPQTPTICVVQPSLCGPTSGSVTILSPIGSDYVYSINNGATWQSGTDFNNLTPGSVTGIKVKRLSSGCISAAASCDASNCASGARTQTTAPTETTFRPVIKVDDTSAETTIKAYPNPFSDKVKFVVTSTVSGNGNLEVYNTMGQKIKTVYTGVIAAGTHAFELSLPTKNASNLVYILRIGDKKITGQLLQLNK